MLFWVEISSKNGDEETTLLGAKRCVHLATCANLDSVA